MCLHLDSKQCINQLQDISFKDMCQVMRRNQFCMPENLDIEDLYHIEGVRIDCFVYDEFTAIPYVVLESVETEQTGTECTIILLDIFDNFFGRINFFQEILKETTNKKILLLNYPGQLFTFYSTKQTHNNESISKILDSLLFKLNEEKTILLSDVNLKLLGIGQGGNIISYFICSSENKFHKLKATMLVNSYSYIDEIFSSIFLTLKQNFNQIPHDIPYLYLELYYQLACTQKIDKDVIRKNYKKNPLSLQALNYLIECSLEAISTIDKIQEHQNSIFVVHSLQNAIVSIQQSDFNLKHRETKTLDVYKNEFITKTLDKKPQRISAYMNGGHEVFLENPQHLRSLIIEFMENV